MNNAKQRHKEDEQYSSFYNSFWKSSGSELNCAELFRISFIVENIRKFAKGKGLNILDYGCGRGWMTPFLSKWGLVTGVDFGAKGIEMALENYGIKAHFLLLNKENEEEVSGSLSGTFDVVVCSEVLEHIIDQKVFLKKLVGFLKPQGIVILTTPNGLVWSKYKSREIFLRKFFSVKPYLQPIENWRSPKELVDLFQEMNLKMLNHQGIVSHSLGTPPWGGLIWLEMYYYNILKLFNKNETYSKELLSTCLYQCIVGQES